MGAKHGSRVTLGCRAVAGPQQQAVTAGAFSPPCTRCRGACRPGGAEMVGPPRTYLLPARGTAKQRQGTQAHGFESRVLFMRAVCLLREQPPKLREKPRFSERGWLC